jgi:DNA segregation ATPase FtsK/SpoIIIE, S-DNA-T family
MAEKGNRVRTTRQESEAETVTAEKPEKSPKAPRKERNRKNEPNTGFVTSVRSFFQNEKLHKFTGLLLLLLSVFMLISFTSFFFTWRADQDKVNSGLLNLLLSPEVKVDNWLGKFGAIISHQFIQKWFGISSYVFVLLSFLSGFRILFKVELLKLSQTVKYSFFAFFFVAASLGFIFSSKSELLYLPGAFGFELNRWLQSIFGYAGTGLLILFSAIAFSAIVFNINFRLPQRRKVGDEDEVRDALEAVALPQGNKLREPDSSDEDEIPVEMDLTPSPTLSSSEQFIPEASITLEIDEETIDVPLSSTELEMDVNIPVPEEKTGSSSGEVTLSIEEPSPESQPIDESELPTIEVLGEYDPTLDLSSYKFPTIDLLQAHGGKNQLSRDEIKAELEANKNRIVETLGHYNIAIDKIKATVGPTVTLFEIIPQAGVRISKIKNLEDDIALSLSALGIRIIAPIPGKGTIGIEVPNQNPEVVSMRSVISSEKFQNSDYDLPIGLGKTISNEVYIADLAKMPHLLMAGATGQGKSVGLNAVLVSLLYKKHPSQVKFVLVDPKKVELTLFKTIERHFLAKLPGEEEAIITDTRKVVNTLNSLCIEMDQRYELLKDAQVRNIREYNAKFVSRKLNPNNGHRFLPFIVLVIDEFADLIMTAGKEVETPIARLAQLARAIGIHLIIATQRPSVNIITGTIKANFPARLAFRVTSKIDSRTILDTGGADQLIGRGDMLLSTGADVIRLQCAFVDTPEVDEITNYIGSQRGYPDAFMLPEYVGEGDSGGGADFDASERDPLFEDAARMVVQHQQGSASLLQRRLKLGYNRAGRLIDQLEAAGIIGPFEGSKAREVKVKDPVSLEQFLNPGK